MKRSRDLLLLSAIVHVLASLIVELPVERAHVDRVREFLLFQLAPLHIVVALHLFLELEVEHILHFSLPVDDVFRNFLVLFGPEVRLSRLLDVFLINFLSHLVHLDLLVQDLHKRVLLLLPLHFAGHLEAIVLFLKRLEFLLVFDFLLSRAHQIHLESLSRVAKHAISIVEIVWLGSGQDSLVLASEEWRLLDETIVQRFLLVVLELDVVLFGLVAEHD